MNFKMLLKDESEEAQDVILTDYDTWPSADELGMDESQYNAFQAALTREISVIQGPPGKLCSILCLFLITRIFDIIF